MEVQVVLAEVREHGQVEDAPRRPGPSASAWLDTSMVTAAHPALDHDGQQRVQVRSLRGGPRRGQHLVADVGRDRADIPVGARPPARSAASSR